MVSLLGNWNYKFPKPLLLKKTMNDYLEDEVDEKYYINTERAQKLIMRHIKNGTLDSKQDFEMDGNFNQRGKVHGKNSICRTLLGCGHAGNEPKVCVDLCENNPNNKTISNCITARDRGISNRKSIGNGVIECKRNFRKRLILKHQKIFKGGHLSHCNALKAEKYDFAVSRANIEEKRLGNIYGFDGGNYAGNVYDKEHLCPTIRTFQGGNLQPMIIAIHGRNCDTSLDRGTGSQTEQRLEPNSKEIRNTLTSVQKDNLISEVKYNLKLQSGAVAIINAVTEEIISVYRIRKLTPLECWRLMGFLDEDFHKAESVNSNSQLYKQAGNSIVKNVLMAIFNQML